MKRATTPTHTFTLPFSYLGTVDKCLITYKQGAEIVLTKTESDIKVKNDNEIVINLTQEETIMFKPNIPVKIEIRILTPSGDALASDIMQSSVEDVLNDEVLS
jgi:hypothetical protein